MVSIVQRMRKMKALLNIRVGTGAAVFPSATASSSTSISPVTRLHLTYARKMYEGHMGARRFWRLCLPRLKYHNPAVQVTVKQIDDQASPALLSVYFANKAGESAPAQTDAKDTFAPEPTSSETVNTIDIRNQDVKEIWAKVKAMTGAQEMHPTESDKQEKEANAQHTAQAAVDRARVAMIRKAKKDQEKMLKAARDEVAKQRAEL